MREIETDPRQQVRKILEELFVNMPGVNLEWNVPKPHVPVDIAQLVDFTFEIRNQSQVHSVACGFKQLGFPQQLKEAIAQLLRYRYKTNGHQELLIVAPYITPAGAEICREDKVSYVDLAGNCRLAMGQLYLERTGRPNPFEKNTMAPRGLYGIRSERILRTLLQQPAKPWKTTPLVEQTGVSAGTVSIVRNLLIERDWAKDTRSGMMLTDPQKLLRDWARIWGSRALKAPLAYFSRASIQETEAKLAEFAAAQGRKFALTGAAAAWRYAPMTRYQRTQAYCEVDPDQTALALGFKRTDSGANVQLLMPRDRGVFDFSETIDGVPVVSPVQTFLDLQRDHARGEEAAEHLWQTKLFHV